MTLVSIEQVDTVGQHRESLRFLARPSDVGASRRSVRRKLRDWSTPVHLDVVELLVSEIVTNAVLHGSAPTNGAEACVLVDLEETTEGLLVHVRNSGSEWNPELADPSALGESGRGLLLVNELADSWGHHKGQDSTTVHFFVRYLDTDSGESAATEDRIDAEQGALADDPHGMSRPCDNLMTPEKRRSSRGARSTQQTRSSPATSTRATGYVRAARHCRAQSHSPAMKFNASIRVSWLSLTLHSPTPLYFRVSLRRVPVQARSTDVHAACDSLAATGRVVPASTRALATCVPHFDCLPRALYWGGRQNGVPGTRIPIGSRDQQDHRTRAKSTGSCK